MTAQRFIRGGDLFTMKWLRSLDPAGTILFSVTWEGLGDAEC
jgi:hypothetical protein